MNKISVIIPSRNEKYLAQTVDDLFAKAKGEIEVVVILDENDQPLKPRPNLIVRKKEGRPGLRSAINQAISLASGKFIMKTDAHCMFDVGFDLKLTQNCEDNWVAIPRRYSLDPEAWTIRPNRPIIDYEYFVFPWAGEAGSKTGGKWYQRAEERKELVLDEDMAFQGSCWITTKEHLLNIRGFSDDTSTGDEFVCESEELANKTWLSGGKVMVNKKTWYAHLYKGKQYGRGYELDKRNTLAQRKFHDDYWMNDRWPKAIHKMSWLVEKFMPIPGWPLDWENPKYQEAYLKSI